MTRKGLIRHEIKQSTNQILDVNCSKILNMKELDITRGHQDFRNKEMEYGHKSAGNHRVRETSSFFVYTLFWVVAS